MDSCFYLPLQYLKRFIILLSVLITSNLATAQLAPVPADGQQVYQPTPIKYSLLVGGIERGDGYSVPSVSIKIAGDPNDGWEFTYVQGGFKMGSNFSEKETLVMLGSRLEKTGGMSKFIIGINGGITQSSNKTPTKSDTSLWMTAGTAFSVEMNIQSVGVRFGVDSMVVPLSVKILGVRNFWYLGVVF